MWLPLLSLLATAPITPVSGSLTICNKGSIDLAVGWLEENRALLVVSTWKAQGWTWILSGQCDRVWRGDGLIHVVLGVRAPGGGVGIISRSFERTNRMFSVPRGNIRSALCVRDAGFDGRGVGSGPGAFVPPCGGGTREAPTSGTFFFQGDAHLKVEVEPIRGEAVIAAAPDPQSSGPVSPAPAPPPPPPPAPPRVPPAILSWHLDTMPRDVREVGLAGYGACQCIAFNYLQQFRGGFVTDEWKDTEATMQVLALAYLRATGTTEPVAAAELYANRILRRIRDAHRQGRYPNSEEMAACEWWGIKATRAIRAMRFPELTSSDPAVVRSLLTRELMLKEPAFYAGMDSSLKARGIDAAINGAIDAWARRGYPFNLPIVWEAYR